MSVSRGRRLLVVLILAFSAVLAIGAPAQAAGCYANSCTGRDPQAMGCSADARTIASFSDGSEGPTYVELRYSPACYAAWTRYSTRYHHNLTFPQIRGYYPGTTTLYYIYGVQALPYSGWTTMVSFRYRVRSCTNHDWYDARNSYFDLCTGFFGAPPL